MEVYQPNIILGIEQYEKFLAQIPAKGKWQAWKEDYYTPYKSIFDLMLSFLYRAPDVEFLQPSVEALDFEVGLRAAETFIEGGGVELVKEYAASAAKGLNFTRAYDVYLLVGLSQVGGTALPGAQPFLYIGMEMWAENKEALKFLVPHEFLHMVRSHSLPMGTVLLGDLVIEEGLATAFSIANQGLPFDKPNQLAALLTMDGETWEDCNDNRDKFTKMVLAHAESPLDGDLMAKYMYSGSQRGSDGVPGNVGYFIGTVIIIDLLERGFDFTDLMGKTAQEILALWQEGAEQ